jgi:hypothetical protein
MEVWKKLKTKGFKNKYLISNFGNVKVIKTGKILHHFKCQQGHRYTVSLYKNGITKARIISKLVLIHFKRYPNQKEISAFLDGNTQNNHIKNLDWMTRGGWLRFCRTKEGKVKGVYKHINTAGTLKWRSTIQVKGKVKTFGYFKTREEAINCTYKTYMEKFGYAPW